MIAGAPHYMTSANGTQVPDPIYLVNQEKVSDIISRITREHFSWTYDGRVAFTGLYQHFL